MIRLAIIAAIIVLAVFLFVSLQTPKLRFVEGRLVKIKGRVNRRLRREFEEIARRSNVTGVVRLVAKDRLEFSLSIGEGARQRFRNALLNSR